MTLDYGTASRAAQLVESLTGSGDNEIDRAKFEQLENICKKFEQFRKLTISDFSVLLKLTVNTDAVRTLPPPKKFAAELELFAIRCLKEWNDEFGKDFKAEFDFVFKYLNKYKKIDFESMTVRSVAEANLLEEREQRQRILNDEKLKRIESHVNELEPELLIAAQTLETCLELLIPTPEEFSIPEVEQRAAAPSGLVEPSSSFKSLSDDSEDENASRRETGAIDPSAVVTITLKPDFRKRVKKTEDNSAIIESINEQVKLISGKYLPKLKRWLQDIAKISNGDLLKRTIELKRRLTDLTSRENKITYYEDDDDCSSDSDMEIVPAASADDLLLAQCSRDESVHGHVTSTGQHASSAEPGKVADGEKDSGRHDDDRGAIAVPKLPFDVDLYHWEDEKLTAPRILPTNQDGHSFWTSNSVMDTDCDGIVQPGGSANLRTRVIEFTGKFERVERQCRAPLPSGRLCPREDRFKCPFHGRIVSRDELGRVVGPENEILSGKDKKPSKPDWQDPQLLRDIQRETGVDLTMPEKGSRKKKKNGSNLINLKKEQNTPRVRLEKKVFKKSSVKKVAKILDNMDQRKFRDKFGDQFNYVHDTA